MRIRLFILVMALVGSLAAPHATGDTLGGGRDAPSVVALAIDSAGRALIKAESHALYASRSDGRDWRQIALPATLERGRITAVAFAARSSEVLYVAGRGFGVWRSADGGHHWVAKNAGLPSEDVAALTSHADQENTLYVYLSGHGIFRSDDAAIGG